MRLAKRLDKHKHDVKRGNNLREAAQRPQSLAAKLLGPLIWLGLPMLRLRRLSDRCSVDACPIEFLEGALGSQESCACGSGAASGGAGPRAPGLLALLGALRVGGLKAVAEIGAAVEELNARLESARNLCDEADG